MYESKSQYLAQRLWKAFELARNLSAGPTLVRHLISRNEAMALKRPWHVPSEQFVVALANGPHMTRFRDPVLAASHNAAEPRTRLFESVHTLRGEWPAKVASFLAAWLGVDVLSSVYEADASDAGLPEHHDAWDNIVLQIEGTKHWTMGDSVVTLEPGDVLIVPTGVMHLVRTPSYSVHINFELVDPEVVADYLRDSTPIDSDSQKCS